MDCVLLFAPGARRDRAATKELRDGLPFLDIAIVDLRGFDGLVNEFFAADRWGSRKGMIEVIAWT